MGNSLMNPIVRISAILVQQALRMRYLGGTLLRKNLNSHHQEEISKPSTLVCENIIYQLSGAEPKRQMRQLHRKTFL